MWRILDDVGYYELYLLVTIYFDSVGLKLIFGMNFEFFIFLQMIAKRKC